MEEVFADGFELFLPVHVFATAVGALAAGCGVAGRCRRFFGPLLVVSALASMPRITNETFPSDFAIVRLLDLAIGTLCALLIFCCCTSNRSTSTVIYLYHGLRVILSCLITVSDANKIGLPAPMFLQLSVPVQSLCVKTLCQTPGRINAFMAECIVSLMSLGGMALMGVGSEEKLQARPDVDRWPIWLSAPSASIEVLAIYLTVLIIPKVMAMRLCTRANRNLDLEANAVLPNCDAKCEPAAAVGSPELGEAAHMSKAQAAASSGGVVVSDAASTGLLSRMAPHGNLGEVLGPTKQGYQKGQPHDPAGAVVLGKSVSIPCGHPLSVPAAANDGSSSPKPKKSCDPPSPHKGAAGVASAPQGSIRGEGQSEHVTGCHPPKGELARKEVEKKSEKDEQEVVHKKEVVQKEGVVQEEVVQKQEMEEKEKKEEEDEKQNETEHRESESAAEPGRPIHTTVGISRAEEANEDTDSWFNNVNVEELELARQGFYDHTEKWPYASLDEDEEDLNGWESTPETERRSPWWALSSSEQIVSSRQQGFSYHRIQALSDDLADNLVAAVGQEAEDVQTDTLEAEDTEFQDLDAGRKRFDLCDLDEFSWDNITDDLEPNEAGEHIEAPLLRRNLAQDVDGLGPVRNRRFAFLENDDTSHNSPGQTTAGENASGPSMDTSGSGTQRATSKGRRLTQDRCSDEGYFNTAPDPTAQGDVASDVVEATSPAQHGSIYSESFGGECTGQQNVMDGNRCAFRSSSNTDWLGAPMFTASDSLLHHRLYREQALEQATGFTTQPALQEPGAPHGVWSNVLGMQRARRIGTSTDPFRLRGDSRPFTM